MAAPAINVFNFLSSETFLNQKIYETQGVNFLHNDLIQCYFQLAENMGWEQVYDRLVKAADGTIEYQTILKSAKEYLNAVRRTKANDHLPN